MNQQIVIEQLNRQEALRYMGQPAGLVDAQLEEVMVRCEKMVLENIHPKYLFKCFDIDKTEGGIEVKNTSLVLTGNDIANLLDGCDKAVLMCATLSSDVDKIIRVAKLEGMIDALATDCLASAAVEQLCNKVEEIIKERFAEYNTTFRYGIGYGDLDISFQREFLNVLNAPKTIGLNVTESFILTPRKSVTAIIGLNKEKVAPAKKGCAACNMKDSCMYRKKGGYCYV